MSDSFEFYWRILKHSQELEGVIVVKGGTSYAAVGWRPLALTAACKAFPPLEDTVVFNGTETLAPESESKPPEVVPKASSEPEPTVDGKEEEKEAVAEPVPQEEPIPKEEPTAEPEPTGQSADHEHHDHHELPTAKKASSLNAEPVSSTPSSRDELIESPTEVKPTLSFRPTVSPRPFPTRPKVPALGRSPLAPKTAPTSTTPAAEKAIVVEVSTTTPGPLTTTKKLTPLEKLMAKNRLNQQRTSTTEAPIASSEAVLNTGAPESGASQQPVVARGTVTRLQLSDLPESGISTGVGGRRRQRRDDDETELVSSLVDSSRRARQQ